MLIFNQKQIEFNKKKVYELDIELRKDYILVAFCYLTKNHIEIAKVMLNCLIISGISWLFGFLILLPIDDLFKFIFSILFCSLNTFQGVYLLLTYLVFKKILQIVDSKEANAHNETSLVDINTLSKETF
jgi:hypothetical protein